MTIPRIGVTGGSAMRKERRLLFTISTILSLSIVARTSRRTFAAASAFTLGQLNQGRFISSASSLSMTTSAAIPPVARRDEDRVVWAGVHPASVDEKTRKEVPRQSESSAEKLIDPPIAIPDPYGWMRDESREVQEVLDHLRAENTYTEGVSSHLTPLRERLYDEMVGSIQETDFTVPRPLKEWVYYTRTFKGKSYKLYCRAPKPQKMDIAWNGSPNTPILPGEQVILDVNALAEGKSYCAVGDVEESPVGQNLVAYSVDFIGGETCQMFVKDLTTGEVVDHDPKLEMYGTIVWGQDDSTLFYLKMDATHRPYQVWKRTLGNNTPDEMLWEEPDDLYWVGISKTLDEKYLIVESSSKETSECWFLDLVDPSTKLQCIARRRLKVEYDVEHWNGHWFIRTNLGGTPNMRLMVSPAKADSQDDWKDVVVEGEKCFSGGKDRALSSVSAFESHLVAQGREGGIPRVWFLTPSTASPEEMEAMTLLNFEEATHDVGVSSNYEFKTDSVLISYDSLITPLTHYEISLADPSNRNTIKVKNVPGYEKELFDCDRITVTARDGKTQIPVSLVYRKDVMGKYKENGETVPTHLYGYGSYGSCVEDDFRSTRLALLNRGIVFAIAHIRGGGEMGRHWYEEPKGGKYLCKKNTFDDFCDVAKWLCKDKKLTTPQQLSCEGRSAGGLLIGASINQAPELFKVAVLGVPFVDVVSTMTDATIPLTAMEWEEWGNPNEEKFHEYMVEYCPMQNIREGAVYPSCLITGGLHDPRVQFWEPAKFAAKLRHHMGEGSGKVCLKMDMTAGHFSASDRYKYLRELAFDYAFLLDQMGIADT